MVRLLFISIALAGSAVLAAPADSKPVKRWYVKADAATSGDGTSRRPFDSLAAAEQASRPGETVVVLPSHKSVAALDGGIALKPGQRLVGAGPPVVALDAIGHRELHARLRRMRSKGRRRIRELHAQAHASPGDALPRLTNSTGKRNSGDAVLLADGATVENLVIEKPHRGGIYGYDVAGVTVAGNDVSGHNTSCTVGFIVLPFRLPTIAPAVSVPIDGLANGWAGIMLDAGAAAGKARIEHNVVHDAECGDGIDIRLTGTADISAQITRNTVTKLKEGERFSSVLAIGVQTQDSSRLEADVTHNRQTEIGSSGADAEGIFANLAGSSRLVENVEHNTFDRGIGGFSVNGLELVITSGNPTAEMRVANSSFTHGPGDMIEAINFGTNATLSLELDHVIAGHTAGLGNTQVIPGNNGDCLLVGHSGPGDATTLKMRHTQLIDCENNGLTIGNLSSEGGGPGKRVAFDVDHSRISANRGYNVRVANLARLERLTGKIQNSDLSASRGTNLAFHNLGTTASATLDLGGGALGSAGRNCILGRSLLAAEVIGYDVAARNNWWGAPAGPAPGKIVEAGGSLRPEAPLPAAPEGC